MYRTSHVLVRGYNPDHPRAKFAADILPQLASHYRCKALKDLEEKSPWLKPFRSAQPILNDARDHFFKDGSDCINKIEKHTELVWLAAVNDAMTISLGLRYTIFLAEFYKGIESEGVSEDTTLSTLASIDESVRDEIKERIQSDSLVQSFMDAEEAMRVENRGRHARIVHESDNNPRKYPVGPFFNVFTGRPFLERMRGKP